MKLILVAGFGGAIGSTLAAALAHGGGTTTNLGMVTHSPRFKKLGLPLDDCDDFMIAGWDLTQADLYEQARRHSCVQNEVITLIVPTLKRMQPRLGLVSGETPIQSWFEEELAWLQHLRQERSITSVVLVNLCPTAPAAPSNQSEWEEITRLNWNEPSVTAGRLYFRFAIEAGAHFINFTPNDCEIEPLTELARARGLLFSGRDGKTGQTFLKTLIAPAFRDKNFRIDGWFSTNILGNSDGSTLSDSSNAATKIASKLECLPEMLGYAPGGELAEFSHQVNIHYYPPRGDAKEAWDNIDFSGMFGQSMQLKLNWLGRDSILAAPAILDLVRLTFLAEAAGQRGLLDALGYFYKTPLAPLGQARIHDVDFQYSRLLNWAMEQQERLRVIAPTIELDAWGWAKWPQPDSEAQAQVQRVLQSGTWAISGERLQEQTQEQAFCREFADFVGMPYGVACSSGSTALAIALEAAGIGYGDRVLVPPSPWVACASAVLAIGGIPVFCDLEAGGLCMCPKQAESMLDTGIKAILLVHSHCAIADLPAFKALAAKRGIPLVEDCSQAHGALWHGQMVGSFGDFSVFSMQQSKVLTSGEGGVVLCRTNEHYEKLQQLRADGRVWNPLSGPHSFHLRQQGQVQGYNYCLSEIQSGLLHAGLKRLPGENRQRAENALLLNEHLQSLSGVHTYFRYDQNLLPTIYKYCVSLPPSLNRNLEETALSLSQEIGTQVFVFDHPVYRHPLYQPQHCRRFPQEHVEKLVKESQVTLHEVESRAANTLCFPHRLFLGKAKSMERICNALAKVMK